MQGLFDQIKGSVDEIKGSFDEINGFFDETEDYFDEMKGSFNTYLLIHSFQFHPKSPVSSQNSHVKEPCIVSKEPYIMRQRILLMRYRALLIRTGTETEKLAQQLLCIFWLQ